MRLSAHITVGVAASLSLAFRPAPHLDKDLLDAIPFEAEWGTDMRVLELPCPECRIGPSIPLRQLHLDHEPRAGETFPESVLRFNVSVVQNDHNDILMLNNCSFYPSPGGCTTVWADQFVRSPCGTWNYGTTPETAFRLSRDHLNDDVLGRSIKLNVLHLWIGRVASKLISPEPEIEVKMLIFPNGQLLIGTDPARAPTEAPPSYSCPPQDHRPGHHHHHHHHNHREHHWCSKLMGVLRVFVSHALIPIVIGLVVAMVAFSIWRKRFLRCQRSPYTISLQKFDNKGNCEKQIQAFAERPDAPLLGVDAALYKE